MYVQRFPTSIDSKKLFDRNNFEDPELNNSSLCKNYQLLLERVGGHVSLSSEKIKTPQYVHCSKLLSRTYILEIIKFQCLGAFWMFVHILKFQDFPNMAFADYMKFEISHVFSSELTKCWYAEIVGHSRRRRNKLIGGMLHVSPKN